MERTIAPSDIQDLIAQGAPIALLDVRRADDRAKEPPGIPSADWRDPLAIDLWSADLDPNLEIVLYCVRGGSVSNSVLDSLRAKGLKARYIEGGLEGWKAAGGATETRP